MDGPGLPIGLLLLVIVGLPLAVAVVLGAIATRGMTELVFRCRRCRGEFRQPPHWPFPARCPHCGSRGWNAAG